MKKKQENGITLIALVITIIVLLILAAVSIATLTGENGILSKANIAKEETEKARVKEEVQLAVMSSYGKDGKLDYELLKENLNKIEGIEKLTGNITEDSFPLEIKIDGYKVTITKDGEVDVEGNRESGNPPKEPEEPEKIELEDAKNDGMVFDTKTEIQDSYGNTVVVPEGFKIASDSATDVTGGIVIEDVENEATAGSQFVWIPVGEVKTANGTKTIELNRYTFADDGTPTKQGENAIDTYYQELATSSLGNTTAKDIEGFKTSAITNHGYYIGRYEARVSEQRTSTSQALGQVTVKPNDYVYNNVTQPQATTLARGMYTSSNFTSDLINSYAWDTAIVFIQNFGQTNYSRQTTLNRTFAEQGTNNLTATAQQDKQLNIWDMASNDWEWTTETYTYAGNPCVLRGGYCVLASRYTSYRYCYSTASANSYLTFRLALYL